MADLHEYTTKEVLNKVLLDSSGNAVAAYSHTSQEALNAVLDSTNSRLNVSLVGGTISGDVTISGDLTIEGDSAANVSEIITGSMEVTGTAASFFGFTSSLTDTTRAALEIKHTTAGNMADGFGSSINFNIKDATSSEATIAKISGVRDGADIQGALVFQTANVAGTNTERMRITNTGVFTTNQLEVSSSNFKYMANGSNANLTVNTSGATVSGTLTTGQLIANGTNFKYMANGSNANLTVTTSGTTVSGTLDISGDVSINSSGGSLVVKNTGTGTDADADITLIAGAGGVNADFWKIKSDHSDNKLYFVNGNDIRAVITSTGELGLGAESPTEKLYIVGELAVEETSSSSGILKFRDTDQALLGQIGLARATNDIATGSANLDMIYQLNYNGKFMWSQQNTNRMTLTSTGLGIGTPSPSQKLHIYDGSSSVVMSIERGDGSNGVISAGSSTTFIGTGDATDIEIGTNLLSSAQTMMFFDHSANKIGIGTTAPNALLSLGEDLTSTSTPSLIISDNALYRGEFGYSEAASTQMWFNNSYDNANSVMQFRMAGSTKMTLTGAGNVISGNAGGWYLYNGAPSSTVPAYAFADDTDTGIGQDGANNLTFISGGSKKLQLDANSRISLSNNDAGGSGGSDSTSGNTLFGYLAGASIASGGINNAIMGHKAGNALTTGDYNVAIGNLALASATAESNNVAIGESAMVSVDDTTTEKNIAIGRLALTGGSGTLLSNIAIGHRAMDSTGAQNQTGTIAIGSSALTALTSGSKNTAIGYQAAMELADNSNNTVIGYNAMYRSGSTVYYNTFIGAESGSGDWSGGAHSNTAVGANTMTGVMTAAAIDNVAIGRDTLTALTAGANNTAVGKGAGMTLTNAPFTTYIGKDAGKLATGANNVVVGALAFDANGNSGTHNVAIGTSAMGASTGDVNHCVAVGEGALSGSLVATGDNPSGAVAIGYQAGNTLTAAIGFTGVGYQAGYQNNGADKSTYIGYHAGFSGAFNHNSTYVGYKSGYGSSSGGENNVGVGVETLVNVNGGSSNVALGWKAGDVITSGDRNTLIGYNVDADTATTSDQTVIGNAGIFKFVSQEYTCDHASADDQDIASSTTPLKIPAYAVIKSVSVIVTQLSNLGTYNLNLVYSDDSSAPSDDALVTNGIELIGVGGSGAGAAAQTSKSGGSGNASDIECGSGAVLKKSFYNGFDGNGLHVGTSDRYIHLVQGGTGNGDTDPSTAAKVKVLVEYVGMD